MPWSITIISILLTLVMKHIKNRAISSCSGGDGNALLASSNTYNAPTITSVYHTIAWHTFCKVLCFQALCMRPPPTKLLIFLSQFTLLYPFLYNISYFLGLRGPLLLPLVANEHLEDLAPWKWSSRGSRFMQMFIRRIPPLENDDPEDLASC